MEPAAPAELPTKRAWIFVCGWALVSLAGCSSNSTDAAVSAEPTVEIPTAAAATPPAPTATPIPAATATPQPAPTPTSEPTATPEPRPTLLLPGDGWQVQFMHADVWPRSDPGPFSVSYIASETGVWGPVIEASFIPDAGYRDIGNRGTPYHDVVTTAGAPVRVRTEFAPRSITAVLAVESGSIVATSYDVSEADLLAVVDGLTVDGGVVVWDQANLPAGLAIIDPPNGGVVLTQYQLVRGDGESLSLLTVAADQWQLPLGQRLTHADGESHEIAGHPALLYGYDSQSRDGAGAVYSDGELFYLLGVGPPDPSSPQQSIDDVAATLDSLQTIPLADIAAQLGLLPRSQVVGAWLDETPLPDDVDLTWMLDGPPTSADQEAFVAHQAFSCAWVGEWIKSGDAAALDQINNSDNWPTATVIADTRPGPPPGLLELSLEQAAEISTPDERRTSSLALDCSFLLGPIAP